MTFQILLTVTYICWWYKIIENYITSPIHQEVLPSYFTSICEENDLGIIFDNTLEFDKDINNKINKTNSVGSWFDPQNIPVLGCNMFVLLYKSLVCSQLEYASSIWHPYKNKQTNKKHTSSPLENVQRHATKYLVELKDLGYLDRLPKLNLPTSYRRTGGGGGEAWLRDIK